MLLWMWEDEFLNFWHPQKQSPDLTSDCILKLTSNHIFSINNAVSWDQGLFSLRHFGHFSKIPEKFSVIFPFWNIFEWLKMALWTNWLKFFRSFLKQLRSVTEKSTPPKQVETQSREMFLDFRTTPLLVHCMAAASLVAAGMFFNELIQFDEDSLNSWANSNAKTAQLDNGFCFLIGNLTTQNQLKLFWNICCFIKLNTKQLSFFQLIKKLFQQIFRNMKTFSGDASKNVFDFKWVECCDLTNFLDVLKPNYFYQIRLYKIGNAWT